MTSQSQLQTQTLQSVVCLSDKFDKILFSITKEQFDKLPKGTGKCKNGKYAMAVKLFPSDIECEKFFSYDIKICFKPYEFKGKKGLRMCGKLLSDNGKVENQNDDDVLQALA
jgi:hypothetical protein